MDGEPFSPTIVKQMIITILTEGGHIAFSGHAYDEMDNDGLVENDVINTLRGGVVSPGELRNNSYRYPVKTQRIGCAIAFRHAMHLVVVTAWRIK